VHEKDITVNGWTGCGYIILDQEIGGGAYKISGGANGGGVWWLGAIGGASAAFVLGIAAFIATVAVALPGALIFFWVLVLAVVLANATLMMQNYSDLNDEDKACYLGGILTGFGLGSFMSLPGWLGKISAIFGIAFNAYAPTSTGPQCGAL